MSGLKQTFLTPLTEVSSVAKEILGSLRFENNKIYKYVNIKNTTATVAGAIGDLVAYFASTGYASNRVVVDLSDADATMPFGAGILCGVVTGTLTVDYYGWIQIKGPATITVAVTSGVAGQSFKMSATDKTGTIATAVTDNRVGVCVNTTTSVALDCPF
jgi:hypothetical protein